MNKVVGYPIIVLLLLLSFELFSYFFLSLDNRAIRARVYWPPVASEAQFQSYIDRRDPLLGWPTKDSMHANTDSDGARQSPANEALAGQSVCVSVYGDSFTYSGEVNDENAWANVLAALLQCPVKNYGVNGYGVDQSVLRFRNNRRDDADLTILGFYVHDMNRNMNQWRYLLTGAHMFTFKPSFSIPEDDILQLHTIPVNSYETLMQTFESPESVLPTEYYLPGCRSLRCQVRPSLPYSWSLIMLAKRIVQEIDVNRVSLATPMREWNYPAWYDTKYGAFQEKIDLNTAIIRYFLQTCNEKLRRCIVLVIPDTDSLRFFQENGVSQLGQVLTPVREYAETWDATGFFTQNTKNKGLCYYVGMNRDCRGHYNKEGYALLADFVAQKIWDQGLKKTMGN